jgi:fatty acid desaturase
MRPKPVKLSPTLNAQAGALRRPDNWHNALYLAGDYAIIAGSIAFCVALPNLLTYLVAVVLIASRMRAFDNLTHEASHRLLFKNREINRWAGMLLCSFPIGTSPYAYWRSHMIHHKNLGDPQVDPDLIRYRLFGVDRFPVSRPALAKHLVKVFLLAHTPRYLMGTVRSFIYNRHAPKHERWAMLAYWLAVPTVVTALGVWQGFLLFWVVPYLTVFQILRYLAEISEHGGLYHKSNEEIELIRNNFCNPLWRPLQYPHHDFFHLVHHLFPGVPHYNLRKVHRLLMQDELYRRGHHCFGYFFSREPGFKSTIGEMVRREIEEEAQKNAA